MMNFILRLFTKRPDYFQLQKGSFIAWYLEFRNELARVTCVNYSICIASWTFKDNFYPYFKKGLSPKEAVNEYMISNNYI